MLPTYSTGRRLMDIHPFIITFIIILIVSAVTSDFVEPIAIPLIERGSQDIVSNKSVRLDDIKSAIRPIQYTSSRYVSLSLENKPERDIWNLYVANINIGSPEVPVQVLIDTGSSVSWVNRKTVTNDFGYDPDLSVSKKIGMKVKNFIYRGKLYNGGKLYKDKINIAGIKIQKNFVVLDENEGNGPNEHVFALKERPFHGVLGLSGSKNIRALFNNDIRHHIFGIFLSRTLLESKMIIGGYNMEMAGEPEFHKTIPYRIWNPRRWKFGRNTWRIRFDEIIIDDNHMIIDPNRALIDTGAPLIYGPHRQVKKFYENIPGYQCRLNDLRYQPKKPISTPDNEGEYCRFPCRRRPNIKLNFNGRLYPISNEDFNLGRDTNEFHRFETRDLGHYDSPLMRGNYGDILNENDPFDDDHLIIANDPLDDDVAPVHGELNFDLCYGCFMKSIAASKQRTWILGISFLKNVYTVFDWTNHQIGFTVLANAEEIEDGDRLNT